MPSLVTVLMGSKVSVLVLIVTSLMSVTKGKAQLTPGCEICREKHYEAKSYILSGNFLVGFRGMMVTVTILATFAFVILPNN